MVEEVFVMTRTFSNGRVFFVQADDFTNPMLLGDIALYQVGENIMECGGEIFWHNQECNEITYVISGSADIYAGDKKVSVKKGDVHVISKDVPHRIVVNDERLRYFLSVLLLNKKTMTIIIRKLLRITITSKRNFFGTMVM